MLSAPLCLAPLPATPCPSWGLRKLIYPLFAAIMGDDALRGRQRRSHQPRKCIEHLVSLTFPFLTTSAQALDCSGFTPSGNQEIYPAGWLVFDGNRL